MLQARAVAAPPQEQLQQAEKPVVKTNGADVEGPIILNGQVGIGHRPLHGLPVLQRPLSSKEQVHGSRRTQPEVLRAFHCRTVPRHAPTSWDMAETGAGILLLSCPVAGAALGEQEPAAAHQHAVAGLTPAFVKLLRRRCTRCPRTGWS